MLSLVIYDIVPSCKSLMQDYTQPVALDKKIGQRDFGQTPDVAIVLLKFAQSADKVDIGFIKD